MRIDIVSIFPEYFGPLSVSLIGKAAARGDIEFYVHDLRQWAHDPHRTVDDTPFGGGPGMVMKPEVWGEALDEIAPPDRPSGPAQEPRLIVPTPSGVPFNQASAARYTKSQQLIFACGRYEGIDTRFIDEARSRMPVDEVSIGDYVLAGGEAAVLVMVEAISRLLPGVLGNQRSASDDSFGGPSAEDGLPPAERGRIMKSHIDIGRSYPEITVNTTYSYGLDDQEFVVCFEGDDPGEFLELVNELRPTESSEYTESETPIFTCVSMSVGRALDALDGVANAAIAPVGS